MDNRNDSKIWVVICESDQARMISSARDSLESGAAHVVLRMDCFRNTDKAIYKHLAHAFRDRCTASLRSVWQGGFFSGDEDQRLETLKLLMDCGFKSVELEVDMESALLKKAVEYARKQNVRIVFDFSSFIWPLPAEALEGVVSGLYQQGDMFFFHAPVKSREDVAAMVEVSRLMQYKGISTCPVAEGKNGFIADTMAPMLGLPAVRLDNDKGSVSSVQEIWSIYDGRNALSDPANMRLIGGMSHESFFTVIPGLYNRLMMGAEPETVYVPMLWGTRKPEDLIDAMFDMGFIGFHVETGLQKAIIDALDTVDKNAKNIMAVDTVSIKDEELVGVNTRYHGYKGLASEIPFAIKDSKVLVLGGAGELRTAAAAFIDMGASVSSSTPQEADRELMREVFEDQCRTVSWKERQKASGEASIVVITPMLRQKDTVLDIENLKGRKVIMDMGIAEEKVTRDPGGHIFITAHDIFSYQASSALSFWTGEKFSPDWAYRELAKKRF